MHHVFEKRALVRISRQPKLAQEEFHPESGGRTGGGARAHSGTAQTHPPRSPVCSTRCYFGCCSSSAFQSFALAPPLASPPKPAATL